MVDATGGNKDDRQGSRPGAGYRRDYESLSQLKHVKRFWTPEHPEIGRHCYDAPGFRLSRTACHLNMPAPLMGQHNEFVCTSLLGMSDAEFMTLMEEGVFS